MCNKILYIPQFNIKISKSYQQWHISPKHEFKTIPNISQFEWTSKYRNRIQISALLEWPICTMLNISQFETQNMRILFKWAEISSCTQYSTRHSSRPRNRNTYEFTMNRFVTDSRYVTVRREPQYMKIALKPISIQPNSKTILATSQFVWTSTIKKSYSKIAIGTQILNLHVAKTKYHAMRRHFSYCYRHTLCQRIIV